MQIGKISLYQFVTFKPLSYCFEETIEFDVKASFASRPVSCLISWYSNQEIQQKNSDKKGYSVPRDFSWIENYKLIYLTSYKNNILKISVS